MAPTSAANAVTHYLSVDGIPCKNPAPKPPATAYDCMMTIMVVEHDDNTTTDKGFLTYRGLLCFHSEFFNCALNGPFREGGSDVYRVTDCKIKTFAMFYNWMNTGAVSIDTKGEKLKETDVVDLYTFADFYAIPTLKNHTMELYFLLAHKNDGINFAAIRSIYKHTLEHCPMRKLGVDILTDTWNLAELRDLCADSVDLAMDLLEAYEAKQIIPGHADHLKKGRTGWAEYMKQHFCRRYHEHTEIMRESASTGSVFQNS